MNCGDWEERIALHAGGDLPPDEAAEMERHLAGCAGCREAAASYGRDLALLHEAHADPIPEAHYAAVRARALAKLEERRLTWRRVRLGGLATAAVAVVVGILWVRPASKPAPQVAVARLPVPVGQASRPALVASGARAAKKTKKAGREARPTTLASVVAAPKEPQPAEPLVVKLYTDDPNVIIYWIADKTGD
ncbi:MAG: zf-HC2 domain-containing protein [Bryobacteraceae bacterium]|jgi:anti-sigma factor RsiW